MNAENADDFWIIGVFVQVKMARLARPNPTTKAQQPRGAGGSKHSL